MTLNSVKYLWKKKQTISYDYILVLLNTDTFGIYRKYPDYWVKYIGTDYYRLLGEN